MWKFDTCAGGGGGGPGHATQVKVLKKWCDLVHSERSKVRYYQPKNQQFSGL